IGRASRRGKRGRRGGPRWLKKKTNHEGGDNAVIFAGVGAALVVDVITWRYGRPSSWRHARMAALAGAGATQAGVQVVGRRGQGKLCVFIAVAPFVGLGLVALFMVIALNVVRRAPPATVDRVLRRLQLLSAAGYSLTNDVFFFKQKTAYEIGQ